MQREIKTERRGGEGDRQRAGEKDRERGRGRG